MMRGAVQKGFDQAMGLLGKVPSSVQAGIDKTHELAFKGFDDFVKYGMNRGKDSGKTDSGSQDQIIDSLRSFQLSMTQSYSQKTYTVSNTAYANQTNNTTDAPAPDKTLDAQA